MRRSVRTIGWVGLVCSLGAIVAVGAVLLTHPRDELGYLEYVSTFGNYDGQHLSDPPPSGTLVAAGDRACAWLDQQQPALWRSDRS